MKSEVTLIRELFVAAIGMADSEGREAFLRDRCSGDAELFHEVRLLLDAHHDAGSFLQHPAAASVGAEGLRRAIEGPTEDTGPTVVEGAGTVIGSYKLLQPIGEGGMGTVYMAEQVAPVRRRVALKVIKSGMDTKQVLARFEAERQALALMDHPHIAKVLDAGTTDAGRPYFVMELVKGTPLTEYCDLRQLTPDERLELFIPVCHAVQHAHQKGVIHRDLKPSNILVAPYDGWPVPRIIDFGVAKATGPKLTDRTLFTEFGAVVGTPQYMSPEQAELNQLDADTRSDIYSLGVLLYELLTGTTPLERRRLEGTAILEVLRLVRDEEPPKPSTRLRTTEMLPAIAGRRGLEPKKLGDLVRGELDWIVMKCLEKDRNRRYETANSLAQDLRRYLDDEPVLACPPTAAYRLRKFARRHKRALAMASAVLMGLVLAVVALGVSTVSVWRANRELIRSSYYQGIQLADREWSANGFPRAVELLEQCPPALRGWEWRHLKRKFMGKALPPLRHPNGLFACVFSPDGKQVVSGDLGGLLYFWDPSTGQELRPLRGHEATCWLLSFSPNGERLASAENGEVKVWDAKTWRLLHAWKSPSPVGSVQGLAFSRDDRLLACLGVRRPDGQEDTSVWDVMTGERLFVLPALKDTVRHLALNADGTLLATANSDRTVTLFDAHTGASIQTFRGDSIFRSVAFSPDGRLIAAGSFLIGEQGAGSVKIWDVATGLERSTITGHGAWSLAFHPREPRLVTSGADQSVRIWDLATGREILTLRGHDDSVVGVAFSPDGHRLVSASTDRTIRVWDASPWREGERTGEDLFTLSGHTNSVTAVAFHPWEPRLVTASLDGSLRVWDTQTGDLRDTFRAGIRQVMALSISPDGTRLAAVGRPERFVTVRDTATGEEVFPPLGDDQHGEVAEGVAFSPNGRYLASADDDGVVRIWETATRALRPTLRGGTFAGPLAFSPDPEARLLAASFADGTVRIWETATGREIRQSPLRHQGDIRGVAFSRDGQLLVTVGWDRAIRIWDRSTWSEVQTIRDTAAAQGVAFSPDSKSLAWGSIDATVKVWMRATGTIHTLRGHRDAVRDVAFSSDGRLIASASRDGTARIWEAPTTPEAPSIPGPQAPRP